MKKTTLVFLLVIAVQNCFAQSTTEQKNDKLFDHYVGAQINPLIMHLINSNANSIGTGNPYLFTYSMNNKKTGWGIRAGAGCNFLSNSTATANSTTVNNNNDLQLRVGVEKIFDITDKWNAGTGFDIIYNYSDDNATLNTVYSYDSTINTTKTKLSTYGGGVFGKVNYHLSHKILIGTECSLYYVTGTSNQTVDYVAMGNNPSTKETKSKPAFSRGYMNLPIVLYLLLKF